MAGESQRHTAEAKASDFFIARVHGLKPVPIIYQQSQKQMQSSHREPLLRSFWGSEEFYERLHTLFLADGWKSFGSG
jgi:hypothetical protein